VLVATVLLQPGKTDAGALFTSNISSTAFGPRGTASILSKLTIAAASVFMVVAFLISMPALQGGVSVLQTVTETPTETPTETAPVVTDSNSNTAAPDANATTDTNSAANAQAVPANTTQSETNSGSN
jgi:preprotein translocase subunit SecG